MDADPNVLAHHEARIRITDAISFVRSYETEYLFAGHSADITAASLWVDAKRALMALATHHAELESEALDAYVEGEAS
jgi:hypothetical protein